MRSESKPKVIKRSSNVFYVKDHIFEQAYLRYWEDIMCPYCDKITEHRRTDQWDLVCIECGDHFVPDPLKKFENPAEKRKWDEYLSKRNKPFLEKKFALLKEKLKQWFVNFETLDEDQFMNSLGKETSMRFTDFDEKRKDVPIKEFWKRLKLAQTTNTPLFYTQLCDLGQSNASKYWNMYYEAIKWLGFEPKELTKEQLEKDD